MNAFKLNRSINHKQSLKSMPIDFNASEVKLPTVDSKSLVNKRASYDEAQTLVKKSSK